MTDERYQKIMADLGMPNSRSLLQALQQVANEVEQATRAAERERCAKAAEDFLTKGRSPHGRSVAAAIRGA